MRYSEIVLANVQDFVRETKLHIQSDRREGARLASRGWMFHWIGGLVVWAIGAAAMLSGLIEQWRGLSWRGNNHQVHRPFAYAWAWMDAHHPVLWRILRAVAPSIPDGRSLRFGWMIWAISWAFLIWGVTAFGRKLDEQGQKLKDRADDTEKQMRFFAPLLYNLQSQQVQTSTVGDVSGSGNVVNAVNTINHMLHEGGKDDGWWTRPVGLLVIGVAIQGVSKFFGWT